MDTLFLSRIQFALTIAYHFIYPPMSIGLGVFLVVFGALYLKTGKALWRQVSRYWIRIFALVFAMGIATGIVQEFQFGTNWSTYSRFVGDVFGSALAAEGIFAFFLESGFLAVLLFGGERLGPRLHFVSVLLVALGAHFSAIWITVANSWMQTPAGYQIVETVNGPRAEITNFWAMVFNPSAMTRLGHVLLASWLTGAFLVISVSAWYLLKGKHVDFAKASLKIALILTAIVIPAQLILGDLSVRYVAEYQPTKLAAEEGHWEASAPADLYLMGWVDPVNEKTYGIAIPGGMSLLLYGDPNAPVPGLNAFAPEDIPPVQIPFQGFHGMVAMYGIMALLTALGILFFWRGSLQKRRWLLWAMILAVFTPIIANQLGWATAEVGRQPWIVYGLMRTADAFSPNVGATQVIISLIMFSIIYLLLLAVFIFLLNDKIQHGPDAIDAQRPIAGLPDSIGDLFGRPRA
ncbi:MAG: cytochrome ubiquinol oxidase subunit I [Caldilineales bacterium]|nr:cytochrome ubiquinol oxidase subunit I [Caldilineales bacterium]